jgi:uncharacterized protein YfaS (alpha-2-macroglobulin family)
LMLLSSTSTDGSFVGQSDKPAADAQLVALVGEIVVLQNPDDGQFLSDGRPRKTSDNTVTPDLGATAFALDVLARARAAGGPVPSNVIDRAAGFLLSKLRRVGDCQRSQIYALAVLAKLDLIGGALLRNTAAACIPSIANDATSKVMLASVYTSFGFAKEAQDLLGATHPEELPSLGDDPAEAARTATLVLENPTGHVDVKKLLARVGLAGTGQFANLATSSWLARAAVAASAILDKGERPFSVSDVAIAPPQLIGRVAADGLTLKRLAASDVPSTGVLITNRGGTELQATLAVDGVPVMADRANSANYAIMVQANGLNIDPDRPLQLRQLDPVYVTVTINQADAYQGHQRLGVVQILPTGFEGIDTSYQAGWSNVIGGAITPTAFSQTDYSEFQEERWIALPSATIGPQHHLLGFSLRPNMQGEFMLPPFVVRDLNNPERIGWTKPVRVTVQPAQ